MINSLVYIFQDLVLFHSWEKQSKNWLIQTASAPFGILWKFVEQVNLVESRSCVAGFWPLQRSSSGHSPAVRGDPGF